jgi:KipI family sensor histidine kinase inhibitor
VVFDPLTLSPSELKARITDVAGRPASARLPRAKLLTVPVFYGGDYGPDLEWVAGHLGISTDEVIRLHTETMYRVYMIGFTPGYPYMGELPAALAVPRRSTPRTRVPKGSVGIAQRQTGIYSVESPGGGRSSGGPRSSCSIPPSAAVPAGDGRQGQIRSRAASGDLKNGGREHV